MSCSKDDFCDQVMDGEGGEETPLLLGTPVAWPPLSTHQHTYIGIYIMTVGVLGMLDNGLVVVMFYRFRSLLTPSNFLLLNLCITDLGICVLGGFPFSGVSSLAGRWLYGDFGCQYYAFTGFFFGIANLTTLLMIALDRYLVTCRQDLQYTMGGKVTPGRYYQMLGFIWVWSLFWAVCPLLGWARYGYEPSVTTCTLDWQHNDASYKSFVMVLCVATYLVPLLLTGACYYHAAAFLRDAARGAHPDQDPPAFDWATEKNVTRTGVMLVVAFVFCWSSYAVVCLWTVFRHPSTVPHVLTLVPPLMAKASPVLNPIIYYYTHPRLQTGMTATLTCWCRDPPPELLQIPETKPMTEPAAK